MESCHNSTCVTREHPRAHSARLKISSATNGGQMLTQMLPQMVPQMVAQIAPQIAPQKRPKCCRKCSRWCSKWCSWFAQGPPKPFPAEFGWGLGATKHFWRPFVGPPIPTPPIRPQAIYVRNWSIFLPNPLVADFRGVRDGGPTRGPKKYPLVAQGR